VSTIHAGGALGGVKEWGHASEQPDLVHWLHTAGGIAPHAGAGRDAGGIFRLRGSIWTAGPQPLHRIDPRGGFVPPPAATGY